MRAIGYMRVSTTNQDLKRQVEKYKEFCTTKGYTALHPIEDFGKTGANFERAGFQQLMQLTTNDADLVVISELSRLSRKEEILDTLNSVQSIISKGLKLLFLDNPEKIYEGTLELTEVLLLSVAAYGAAQERLTTKRRNTEGKSVLFDNVPNAIVDGKIPYGFKKIPNNNGKHPKYLLAFDENEARVVRAMFNLVVKGSSVAEVARRLYDTDRRNRNGEIFTKQALSKLFSNPIYKGDRTRKGKTMQIEPLVKPEIWENAQLKIKENYQYGSTGTTMFNPLRGIIRCRCGRAMMVKNKGGGLLVYRCSDVQPFYMKNKCKYGDSIRFDLTNEVMFSLLQSIDFVEMSGNTQEKIEAYEKQITQIENQIIGDNDKKSSVKIEITSLEERYLNARTQSLADRVQEEIIKKEDEISSIDRAILKKTRTISQIRNQIRSLKEVAKTEDFTNLDINERAKLFRKYIKKIHYLPVTTMQGFYNVEFQFGVTEKIAIKKTTKSPVFVKVPPAFEITSENKLQVTSYDPALAKATFDFGAMTNQEITIQQFFNSYAEEFLDVDLSYRECNKP
ncbi:recombinase family protein [Maribellus sediminis]|uniref:recombinase family protein n=1 Tax=Maribellus sediminis TaxID=2696285 RepID=UPI0014319CEE|nr:recombinase family protein [Maribellus sediminis]